MHVHGIRNPLQDKLDKKKQGEYTWLTSNKQLKEDGPPEAHCSVH